MLETFAFIGIPQEFRGITLVFGHSVPLAHWIVYPALFLVLLVVGWYVGTTAIYLARKAAARTETDLDDVVLDALTPPSHLGGVLLGIYVALLGADIGGTAFTVVHEFYKVGIAVLATWAGLRLARTVLPKVMAKSEAFAGASGAISQIARIAVVLCGATMVFHALGIPIAPLITALGVGSLAVALALQDTLSNFFAGIQIHADRPVREGDFVRLESGQEGVVERIGWRATRVRTVQNHLVYLPNSRLAGSQITNYSQPEADVLHAMTVGVSYSADPDRVMRILMEEARAAIGSVPDILPSPEPVVRFLPGYGESSIDFTLVVAVRSYREVRVVESDLRARIFRRLRAEGIEIPFPQRDIHIRTVPEKFCCPPDRGAI